MNSRIEQPSTIQVMIRMTPALKSKFDTIKKDLEEDIRIETDVITRLSNAAVVDYLCNDGVITERHLNQKDRSFGLKATDKISDRLERLEKECDDGVITERHWFMKDILHNEQPYSLSGLIAECEEEDIRLMTEIETIKAQLHNLFDAFVEHVPDYADKRPPKE